MLPWPENNTKTTGQGKKKKKVLARRVVHHRPRAGKLVLRTRDLGCLFSNRGQPKENSGSAK